MAKKRKSKKPRAEPVDVIDDDDEEEPTPTPKKSKKKGKKKTGNKKRKVVARADPDAAEDEVVSNASAARPKAAVVAESRTEVDLDERKLTKKQKSQLAGWRGKNRGKKLDAYFRGQVDEARKKHGHQAVLAGSDTQNLVIGIPCPALAFEYLITQDVFPLGLIIQLNGLPGSLKSALLYEFFRWFRTAGGGGILMEVETKYSPDLAQSILGFEDYEVGLILNRCESLEDWQKYAAYWLAKEKKDLVGTKAEPGPGRTIPILFGVDSVMGKMSEQIQEKVTKQGHGSQSHPLEALFINQWLKTYAHEFDGWPFTLVLNNHLKMGRDDMNREIRRTAGGSSVNFQESWELECKVRKSKLNCADWDGVQISIRCYKNSFGVTGRSIDTRMLWWEEEDQETGQWRQKTVWDWDWATVKLLVGLQGRAGARLKDVFHIDAPKTGEVENTAWSRTLGMKKSDAENTSWSELGVMIRKDPKVMKQIRDALSIKPRPLLAGDYAVQMEEMGQDLP